MAEARVKVVDDNVGLAALFGASGEFAAREDLEKFRDLVPTSNQLHCSVETLHRACGGIPVGHVRSVFVVQGVEYPIALSFVQRRPSMNLGADNSQVGRDVELLSTLAQLRQ